MSSNLEAWVLLALLLASGGSAGCGPSGAPNARGKVRLEHAPRAAAVVLDDLVTHTRGLSHAADRIAAGFVVVQGEQQEREMRQVLGLLRSPKKGVRELVISPLSFIAAVDKSGIVIARNAEPDKMKGMDLGKQFACVRDALAGKQGYEVGEFATTKDDGTPGDPSVSVVMAAPAHYRGEVVGALVLGIPYWRLAQQLSKQLQMEEGGKAPGTVIWAYLYRGDKLFHHGTPGGLDEVIPDAAARKAGLSKSPGGYTGDVAQYGRWYGYGVRPIRVLDKDTGVVVIRMDPQ